MITAHGITDLYPRILELVLNQGQLTSPRGMKTRELHPELLCLTQPQQRILLHPLRPINPGFMCAEAIWILSGSNDPWIFTFNKQLSQYADQGVLQGAYGPRLRHWGGTTDQILEVIKLFARDRETRQATMIIFDPAKDFQPKKDVPCTNMLRFMLRNDSLDMITIMRSQDIWLGLPYDLFTFTLLHEVMAGFIGAKLGMYYHFIDSLHLYEQHWEDAERIIEETSNTNEIPTDHLPATISWSEFDPILRNIISFAGTSQQASKLRSDMPPWWKMMALTMIAYQYHKKRQYDDYDRILASIQESSILRLFQLWSNRARRH